MNITVAQIKAIRKLLNKDDKCNIALHTEKSEKLVQHVLQGERTNNEIEELIVMHAEQNLIKFSNIIADIKAKNVLSVTTESYRKYRSSAVWSDNTFYSRYMDIYIQLVPFNIKDLDELWIMLWDKHKDIIKESYYCIDILIRTLGIDEATAVRYYNKKIRE
jgi:hypothetical protein